MTKAEARHLDQVQQLGCIVCLLEGVYSPAEIHHILDGGRRKGHMHVLPLCFPHHRNNGNFADGGYVARHPYKRRFEDKYGTEQDLLAQVEERLHG